MRRFLAPLVALVLTLALGGHQAGANPITWNYSPDGTSASLPGSATVQGNLGVTGNTTLQNLTVNGSANLPVASITCSSLPALTGPVTTSPGTSGCATSITGNAVTLGDLAQIAGGSLIGTPKGSSATPSAIAVTECNDTSYNGLTYWTGTFFGCDLPGQYPGTETNDNAAAQMMGEYIASSVGPTTVALTTSTVAEVTSVSLTAGDWNCWANESFSGPSASVTGLTGAINTSIALPTPPNGGAYFSIPAAFSDSSPTFPVGMIRESLASTTTIYLVVEAVFSAGTLDAGGSIACRRAR